MNAFGSLPPAPPPSADLIVRISFTPAKIVTTVALVCTNGIWVSIMLPTMMRPYIAPRAAKSLPMTVVGIPPFRLVTVNPCALSARTVTGT